MTTIPEMGVLRFVATGIKIPIDTWPPFVQMCVDGKRQDDVPLQPLLSVKGKCCLCTFLNLILNVL